MIGPDKPDPRDEMQKNKCEAEIERFKSLVKHASVEEVDTPTGRKTVEIAYTDNNFIVESGKAVGVYIEPDRRNPYIVKIDWDDGSPDQAPDKERTEVLWENIKTFEESDYQTLDENTL